jgi:hypothetical protein
MITKGSERVIFYGVSDDFIEVDGSSFQEEINDTSDGVLKGYFHILGTTGQAKVYVLYDGCWSFAFAKYEEDIELPEWDAEVHNSEEVPYSTMLCLTLPDRTAIVWEPQRKR